ncbi:MAG: hypothetical protein WD928_01125 [Gammaproteobacteria bacterium]
MSDSLAAIDRLRGFVADPMNPDAAGWVAEGLARYLEHAADGMRLEEALGLAVGRDAWPWWRLEQRDRERDAARKLVGVFGGDHRHAHQQVARYASSRGRVAAPDAQYSDPAMQAVHDYLQATGRVPDAAITLRRAADRDS